MFLYGLGSLRFASQKDITETPMRTRLPLPRGWNRRVRSSALHILALSHYSDTYDVWIEEVPRS